MATSTKRDFSNYGTLAKTARRFHRVCAKHYERSAYDHSPESVKETEEIDRTYSDIVRIAGGELGSDIVFSMKYGYDVLRAGCFNPVYFGFRLGVLTALGFKKVLYRVSKKNLDAFIDNAKEMFWEFDSQTWEGDTCVDILLINKRQGND